MLIPELSRNRAERQMMEWRETGEMPEISLKYKDFVDVRQYLQSASEEIYGKIPQKSARKNYIVDVEMGLALYSYMNNLGLSLRSAANHDFWRYMTMIVAPDVVKKRWDFNDERYWTNPRRNWFGEIWWYVHCSWQGNVEMTKSVLLSPYCSTDTMNNLVERTGKEGTNVGVYRNIMNIYTQLDKDVLKNYNRQTETLNDSLFRTVMRLHTAKIMVMEPELCKDGEMGYAKSLFLDAGIVI